MNTCVRLVEKLRIISIVNNHLNFRHIYSLSTTGMHNYTTSREKYTKIPKDKLIKFRQKISDTVDDKNEQSLIFSEDLLEMMHIAEPTDSDLTLINKMLIKYQKQNARLRFSTYGFGPVIMRMYHYFNKPEEALKVYNTAELDGLFDQLSSHLVLMDLLFKNKMYNEIVDLYKVIRDKQLSFGKHPKCLMILLFGALYKINTEEAYNYMLTLWKELIEGEHTPLRRVSCFAAALALNCNNPHICLEILSSVNNQNFIIVRSLKALAYCALGKISDAQATLATILIADIPNAAKHTYPHDVVSKVKDYVKKENRKEFTLEFSRLEKQLKEHEHICNETLDELLCAEINTFVPLDRQKYMIRASLVDNAPNLKKQQYSYKPGLLEIT